MPSGKVHYTKHRQLNLLAGFNMQFSIFLTQLLQVMTRGCCPDIILGHMVCYPMENGVAAIKLSDKPKDANKLLLVSHTHSDCSFVATK